MTGANILSLLWQNLPLKLNCQLGQAVFPRLLSMQNCANKDHIIQFRPKSLAGAVSAAHTTMAAQQALRTLQEVAKGPNRPVIYTPPEMIPQWQPEYAQKVKQAVAASLDAGVSAEKVYKILDSIAAVDLDGLPADLLALCVDAGLGADTDMGGEPLLHFLLNTQYPVPLGQLSISPAAGPHAANRTTQQQHQQQQPSEIQSQDAEDQHTQTLLQRLQDLQKTIPAQHHAACGSVTLAELLKRGATPDLSDASENTALHMVVACMVSKKHFPDPAVAGQQQQPDADGIDSSKRNGTSKTAGAAQQQQLEDNDAARAAYAAAVFTALLRAGWDPAVRNANGYTVSDLILEGLSRYQTGVLGWSGG